jgi:hypothetical protein
MQQIQNLRDSPTVVEGKRVITYRPQRKKMWGELKEDGCVMRLRKASTGSKVCNYFLMCSVE